MPISGWEHGISRKQTLTGGSFNRTRKYIIEATFDPLTEDEPPDLPEVNAWMANEENIPFILENAYIRNNLSVTEIAPMLWTVDASWDVEGSEGGGGGVNPLEKPQKPKPTTPKPGEAKLRFQFGSETKTITEPGGYGTARQTIGGFQTNPLHHFYYNTDPPGWVADFENLPKYIGVDITDGKVSGTKVRYPTSQFTYDFTLPEHYVHNPAYLLALLKMPGKVNNAIFDGLERGCVLCTGIQGDVSLWDEEGTIQNKYATLSFSFEYRPPEVVSSVGGFVLPTAITKLGFDWAEQINIKTVNGPENGKHVDVTPRRYVVWPIYPWDDFRKLRIPGTVRGEDYTDQGDLAEL